MSSEPDHDSPFTSIVTFEQTLLELDAATKRAAADLERIAVDRAAARDRADAAVAALPSLNKRISRGKSAQEQAVRERADLERRYADLLEAETIARARFEQAEQRVEAFRSVEFFARAARENAVSSGNVERAGREHDAEDRATREREEAEARLADLHALAEGATAERTDVEQHVFAERAVEDDVSSDRVAAESERSSGESAIARAKLEAETFEADAAAVRLEIARLDAEKVRIRELLVDARERAASQAASRIEVLRAAEGRKRLERMEAERIVAAMRAEEEALAQERAALERSERERLDLKRTLERREAYDRNLDERLAKKRLEESAADREPPARDDPLPPISREPAATATPAPRTPPATVTPIVRTPPASPPGARPTGLPARVAASSNVAPPRQIVPPEPSKPGSDGGFFGRFGRRRRDHELDEPQIDVASRIARDFGMLGDTPPAAPTNADPKP